MGGAADHRRRAAAAAVSALTDVGAVYWRRLLNLAGKEVAYQGYGLSIFVPLRAYVTGMRSDNSPFGGALQSDRMAVIDAADFAMHFPGRPRPLRYDRLRTLGPAGMTYTVEEWRGSPEGDDAVVFRILLRGGNQ
jgi:hypothetical protein